jgi:hypothetical protein
VACAVAAAGAATAPAAAGERPAVEIIHAPAALRPGDLAAITARTAGARSCRLRLAHSGSAPVVSVVAVRGRSTVTWRWRVPGDAAAARWAGSVRCSALAAAADWRAPGVRVAPLAVAVTGAGAGARALADVRGVAAGAVADKASALNLTALAQLGVGVLGLLVAAAGLWYVGRQLIETRRNAQSDRTAQLLERYARREFIELWSRVGNGFLRAPDLRGCFERMRAFQQVPHAASALKLQGGARRPPARYSEVWYTANFHEEVGVLYNVESVANEQIIRHFGATLVNNFDTAWWWIHWQRGNRAHSETYRIPAEHETELFAEWQRMVTTITGERPDLRPKADARGTWVICVPADDADAPEWDRHLRLSERLTAAAANLAALTERVEGLALTPQAPPEVYGDRVLCVMPWLEHEQHAADLQRLAAALGARLADNRLAELEALVTGSS